jgi:hypothetical protein
MAKFRQKPVVVEAWRVGKEPAGVVCFCDSGREAYPVAVSGGLNWVGHIHTLEGPMLVLAGDWIIKGVMGEFYPCKPDIFEATYEPVKP